MLRGSTYLLTPAQHCALQENYDGSHDAAYTAAVQPVVDAIRATGAPHLMAIGSGRDWARYADGFVAYPIHDPLGNWAAALHLYLHPSEFDGGTAYCRAGRSCIVEEFGPVGYFSPPYTLAEVGVEAEEHGADV